MNASLLPYLYGGAMFVVALIVVVLNDWTKRRAVAKAVARGKTPRPQWLNNTTDVKQGLSKFAAELPAFLAALAIVFATVFYGFKRVAPALVLLLAAYVAFVIVRGRRRARAINRYLEQARGGDLEGAIRDALRHAEERPRDPTAWAALACLYSDKKDWAAALRALDRHRQLRPKDNLLTLIEAQVLSNLGRPQEAEDLYRRAIAKEPHHVVHRMNFVRFLVEQGQIEQAAEVMQEVERHRGQIIYPGENAKKMRAAEFEALRDLVAKKLKGADSQQGEFGKSSLEPPAAAG